MSVHWKLAQFSSFTTYSSQFTMFYMEKQFHKEHIQSLGCNAGELGYHYVFKIRHVWISQKLKLLFVLSRKGHLPTSEVLLKLKRAACPRTAIVQCLNNGSLSHWDSLSPTLHRMGSCLDCCGLWPVPCVQHALLQTRIQIHHFSSWRSKIYYIKSANDLM